MATIADSGIILIELLSDECRHFLKGYRQSHLLPHAPHMCLLGSAQWRHSYSMILPLHHQLFKGSAKSYIGRWEKLSWVVSFQQLVCSQARPQGKQRRMKGLRTIPRPSFQHLTYFFSGHCALPFKWWFPEGLGTALQQTVSNAAGSWCAQARLHGNGSPRPDHPVEFSHQLTAFLGLENKATIVTPCSVERGSVVQCCCCCC